MTEVENGIMQDITRRFLDLMDFSYPKKFKAEFSESIFLITPDGQYKFESISSPKVQANRILIDLLDEAPKAVFKNDGVVVQIRAIYGFPKPDSGWTKYSIANAIGLSHVRQCKMVVIDEDNAKLYFGTCLYQEEAFLYVDVTFNCSTNEIRVLEKVKLVDTRALGLEYDEEMIPHKIPDGKYWAGDITDLIEVYNADKLSRVMKVQH